MSWAEGMLRLIISRMLYKRTHVRRTSHQDGVGLAWSICEHFIQLGAFSLCVTHFPELSVRAIRPQCASHCRRTPTHDHFP